MASNPNSSSSNSKAGKENEEMNNNNNNSIRLKVVRKLYENFITRSSYFNRLCEEVFKTVDYDKNHIVDSKEAYVAVLLLYIKLALFVRGLTPPQQTVVDHLMVTIGADEHKGLDLDQFKAFCTILCADLVGRITIQSIFAFLIVPVVATNAINFGCSKFTDICLFIDRHDYLPSGVPVTIVSTILVMTLVPWVLEKVDNFFASLKRIDSDKSNQVVSNSKSNSKSSSTKID